MMSFPRNQILTGALVAAALGVTLTAAGCSSNPLADACCTDFKVGADMGTVNFGVDASLKGEYSAFAQGAGDFSAAASSTLLEVEAACRAIAQDLGATETERATTEALEQKARVKAWCSLAVAKIKANAGVQAAGTISVQAQPPQCSASVSAKANCQAKCSVDGKCDIKANPPKCTGGKLEVSCKGTCKAEGSATLSCTGGCTGECKGSCEAKGGVAVDCQGRCEGTCAAGGSANGSGVQADGTCKGTCQGKCTATAEAPSLTCSGTCSGSCTAECKAEANVAVKCDGKCEGDFEPLRCEGGKLEGGCSVSAECNANCDASVSAKAECTPPSVRIVASGSLSGDAAAQFNLVRQSLEENLPNVLLAFKARGQAFVDIGKGLVTAGGKIVANGDKLGLKGVACGTVITGTIAEAAGNVEASFAAAGSLAAAVNVR